ncbi:uncharacterized protein CEXT_466181 [Caerostris extrusa]|uniref:Uncharacterized protein n=1 Tax=Caerostris extrusa TaxID=172846 RepID=A0AAV4WU83_CAEEX|nr:uncharacterized protein CEXT_466181 [Caerostris extrusa]
MGRARKKDWVHDIDLMSRKDLVYYVTKLEKELEEVLEDFNRSSYNGKKTSFFLNLIKTSNNLLENEKPKDYQDHERAVAIERLLSDIVTMDVVACDLFGNFRNCKQFDSLDNEQIETIDTELPVEKIRNHEFDKIAFLNIELKEKLKKAEIENKDIKNKLISNVREIYQIAEFKAFVAEDILRLGLAINETKSLPKGNIALRNEAQRNKTKKFHCKN